MSTLSLPLPSPCNEEAVAVVYKITAYNSTTSSLTLEQLTQIGSTMVDVGARRKAF
jgi:hypothetical protein